MPLKESEVREFSNLDDRATMPETGTFERGILEQNAQIHKDNFMSRPESNKQSARIEQYNERHGLNESVEDDCCGDIDSECRMSDADFYNEMMGGNEDMSCYGY